MSRFSARSSGLIPAVPSRIVLHAIFETAIAQGKLTHDKTLIDATSGNMDISYAMTGSALGYRVHATAPDSISDECRTMIRAFGAEIDLTDPTEKMDGAIIRARELALDKTRYYFADQFKNGANVRSHYESTGLEIWQQAQGKITHLVAGVGTAGTLMGSARRLKEFNPAIKIIEVQPASEQDVTEGLKFMGTAIVPGIYENTFADANNPEDADAAMRECRRSAREEGLFVGPSAGAAIAVARQLAREIDIGILVTILPDGGDRDVSTPPWKQ